MLKRFLFLLMALLTLLTCFSQFATEVRATPETHPNTYANTGDQIADLIGVALTQVGYREGPGNDTKYGAYFNLNYHAWCGLFVSWCAVQAGIPDSVMIKTGIASPQAYGLPQHPAGYTPKTGDLYFTPNYSHVGIVYYVEGDYFYSLEGNTWETAGYEGVHIRKKLISEAVFATPKYTSSCKHSYGKGYESSHPHNEYYKCTVCGYSYYSGETTTDSNCQTCRELNCSHTYGNLVSVNDSVHARTCSSCGKVVKENHGWSSWNVTQSASCKTTGSKTKSCSGCGAVKTETIAKLNKHDYGKWERLDEEYHVRICSVCHKEEKEKHDEQDDWATDQEKHWKSCETCDSLIGETDHEFSEACDSPCSVCEYVREEGHPFSTKWSTDVTSHWKECENCDAQDGMENHVFSADCDSTCDVCGFVRDTDHEYGTEWITDGTFHWYECAICGDKKGVEAHIPTEVNRRGAIQYCTVCDLMLTSEAEHIHGFDLVQTEGAYHFGTCSCGLDMEAEAHVWEIQTGKCQVCGAIYETPADDCEDLIPSVVGGGALLLITTLTVILCFAFKKK